MTRLLMIPVTNLTGATKCTWLRFLVSPVPIGSFASPYKNLTGLRLDPAISAAKAAARSLRSPRRRAALALCDYLPEMSDASGAALGLMLASYLAEPDCPFPLILSTGRLTWSSGRQTFVIEKPGQLNRMLYAALRLGRQPRPVPFLIPADSLHEPTNSPLIGQLAKLGILPIGVRTADEALRTCTRDC